MFTMFSKRPSKICDSALPFQPGTNIVLPPNYQLPPGTMLVKNEQGQLMLVTQQQAQTFKVPTRVCTKE